MTLCPCALGIVGTDKRADKALVKHSEFFIRKIKVLEHIEKSTLTHNKLLLPLFYLCNISNNAPAFQVLPVFIIKGRSIYHNRKPCPVYLYKVILNIFYKAFLLKLRKGSMEDFHAFICKKLC